MATRSTNRSGEETVGTRRRADIERECRRLEQTTPFARGAASGYRWALGRDQEGPVTGVHAEGPPGMDLLTAEVDAAVVRLEEQPRSSVPHDHIQGVHDALAWVCGHTEDRPS
ncbi:hypothetical protein AB0N28_17480 [Streptomyces sp. NPDC051130]|uniref:hypothetical protein n=1 Tax=Streptomyces sp. NPDC051130 TaxID=3157223 RepID=UPI00343ADF5C